MTAPLAIEGGVPVRTEPYPRQAAPVPATDADPRRAFEHELSAFAGGPDAGADGLVAVACADRTAALRLALDALELDAGEVVVPALHGEPVARALLAAGLRPVPAEVDPETGNLSARGLALARGPETRALVVTHAFGHPARMRDILRLAQDRDLAVIEDVTDALGASVGWLSPGADLAWRPVGTMGHAAVLETGEGHLLTGGGGGGAVLLAGHLAGEAGAGATGGEPAEDWVRMALAELREADAALDARRRAAWHLSHALRGLRGLARAPHDRHIRHTYDRYVVRIRPMLWRRSAAETVEALRAEGVPCALAVGAPLNEDGDVRAALGEDDPRLAAEHFQTASLLSQQLLAIPLNAALTSRDMDQVAEAIRKVAAASTPETGAARSESP